MYQATQMVHDSAGSHHSAVVQFSHTDNCNAKYT